MIASSRAASTRHEPGDCTATFDFGGVAVRFSADDERWVEHVVSRYSPFRSVGTAEFEVRYERDPVSRIWPDAVDIRSSANGFAILGPHFSADVDLLNRTAVVFGPEGNAGVDCLVKRLIPHLHPDALVVHSAVACDGTRGMLLSGPSGAGKSTIASLLGDHALCDELALVHVADGCVTATALPLWTARPGTVDLRGIFMLRHAPGHGARRLSEPEAVRALGAQVVWPLYCAASMSSHLLLFEELVRSVPVFDLGFAPRPDVWETILEEIHRA